MRISADLDHEDAGVHVPEEVCNLVGLEKLALVAVHDHHVPPGQDLSCVEVLPAIPCNIDNNKSALQLMVCRTNLVSPEQPGQEDMHRTGCYSPVARQAEGLC